MTAAALDIEKLSVAMAAAVGFRWDLLDEENRCGLRRYASAALMRLGVDARTAGKAALADTLETAAKAAENAVAAADATDGHITEATRQALQASVQGLRVAAAVLLAIPEPQGVDAASTPPTEPVAEAF